MGLRIKDIAQELGISMATVSMVLNNRPGISDETREKVISTIKQMDHTGNILKRINGDTQSILSFIVFKNHGRVVTDTPFFSAVIEGIENEARSQGYNITVNYIDKNSPTYDDDFIAIKSNIGQGLLLLGTEIVNTDFSRFMSLNVPMIVLDNTMIGMSVNKVLINNFEGSYKAVKYLYEKGHRKIGYLQSSAWIKNFDERKGGYNQFIKEVDLDVDERFIVKLEPTLEGAYGDMNSHLDKKPQLPTAFFADNDIIAVGAMKSLKEHGIAIPDDISIIGFDDMPFCNMVEPGLTTMRVPKHHIGKLAVQRLLEQINGTDKISVKIEVDTELIERHSVKRI